MGKESLAKSRVLKILSTCRKRELLIENVYNDSSASDRLLGWK
jgi:hypothetical protein